MEANTPAEANVQTPENIIDAGAVFLAAVNGWNPDFARAYAAHQVFLRKGAGAGQKLVATPGLIIPKGLLKTELGRADLSGADLTGANLAGANLTGADLTGAFLYDANLRGAFLYDANLGGASLYDANLGRATLGGANLGGAFLYGTNLREANLRGANLGDADLTRAYLGDADLSGARGLTVSQLAAAHIDSETKLPEGISLDKIMREKQNMNRKQGPTPAP